MRHLRIYITLFLLILFGAQSNGQMRDILLTLRVRDAENYFPKSKKDWFSVVFLCTIKNNSNDTIYFVNPQAYKICPHPWIIAINDIDAKFWSGDIMCAPSFTKKDIIKLAPHDTIIKQFEWNTFVSNFSQKAGVYKAKVKYNFSGDSTLIIGADKTILTNFKSNYSMRLLLNL